MATPFSIHRRVQFAETDMAGIAHFANFLRWMEEAEHALFRSVGLSVAMHHEGSEISWPRVSVGCEYFQPVRFEDELDLRLRIVKIGEKSLSMEVDFMKGDQRVALGKATSVCCNVSGGKMRSIPIPPSIREKLAEVAP
ncbi:MAG: thioesterase family protein [Tepidisphaeraceae bacterium]